MIERDIARRWMLVTTLKEMEDEDFILLLKDCMVHQADLDTVWNYIEMFRKDWMEELNIHFSNEEEEE